MFQKRNFLVADIIIIIINSSYLIGKLSKFNTPCPIYLSVVCFAFAFVFCSVLLIEFFLGGG